MIIVLKTLKNLVKNMDEGFKRRIKNTLKKASARKIQNLIKRAMKAKNPSIVNRQNQSA